MTTIVSLQTRPKAINAEVVKMLRELLAQAEAGDIEGLAYAAQLPNGSCLTESSTTDQFQRLIGAVAILQHDMIASRARTEIGA